MPGFVAGEQVLPGLLEGSAGGPGIPAGADVIGQLEGRERPPQVLAGSGRFGGAQRLAMHLFRALTVRCPVADDGLAADQGRPAGLGPG